MGTVKTKTDERQRLPVEESIPDVIDRDQFLDMLSKKLSTAEFPKKAVPVPSPEFLAAVASHFGPDALTFD